MSEKTALAGRYVNAGCYAFSGIVALAVHPTGWTILVGLLLLAYGLYVGLTRGAYLVSAYTYAIPVICILIVILKAKQS